MLDEIGRMLLPGALNDSKKIRKASADIFANVGAEKPGNNNCKIKIVSRFFQNVPVDYAQNGQNPCSNDWAPYSKKQ